MDERLGVKNIGLRGIKVADTRISDVDGERGILIYRGFNVDFYSASVYHMMKIPVDLFTPLESPAACSGDEDIIPFRANTGFNAPCEPPRWKVEDFLTGFTPVFAISRISGWAAHVIEEKFAEAQPKPELYRPDADYVGAYCGTQACPYIPMGKRSS